MKDKRIAGLLALFVGWLGVHRFYLGKIGQGVMYLLLSITGISFVLGLIDAIVFLTMDQERFDYKYNQLYFKDVYGRFAPRGMEDPYTGRPQRPSSRNFDDRRNRPGRNDYRKPSSRETRKHPYGTDNTKRANVKKAAAFMEKGKAYFSTYDYVNAVESFEKAKALDPNNIPIHFNLACCYSLEENAAEAFRNIDEAVALGFRDFEKIETHDAFAYLRVQPNYEAFKKNGYRRKGMEPRKPAAKKVQAPTAEATPDLLEQLNRLQDLRKRGLLSQEEYELEKRKLNS